MKLGWVTLMVKNLDESLAFFMDVVGLAITRRIQAGPGVELAFLCDGESQVELICNQNNPEINPGNAISLGFEVNSLEAKMASLKEQGIEILGGPLKPNPHIQFIYVLDPNGFKIQFFENI
ncbi:VOC family protein [Eubacteriaceae bacterium ES3]|nr:VOC family protein [Eubacteriaceae bacterium ES3]